LATAVRRRRLRRSDCSGKGLRRVRRGRGFAYLDAGGGRVTDPETLTRVRALAIPPAWEEVWICPDPLGHLQATGSDAAGRKQYLYHEQWREQRDRDKFRRMLRFAERLPCLRRRVASDLRADGLERERILAGAIRLLDVGLFRIGGEEYADNGGGLGLATLHRQHVKLSEGSLVFDYPAKGGTRRIHGTDDPLSIELVRALKRRRDRCPELLAYRDGRHWVGVRSEEINEYLKDHAGEEFSAKDFRTWNATVLAAVALAATEGDSATKASRKRTIDGAVRSVAEVLGNTPAVARRAYIDPQVFDRYLAGQTVTLAGVGDLDGADERARARVDRAVLEFLNGSGS
jgi:DNA topoisomerase-1